MTTRPPTVPRPPPYLNQLLNALTPASIERLQLRAINLPLHHAIESPGSPIRHLYFLESGVASMTTTFLDGDEAEVAVIGNESLCGTAALLGVDRSLNRVYMQIVGRGHTAPIAAALEEFNRASRFHTLVLHAIQAQFLQTAQTAGCNCRHPVEQRLIRWLLLCDDRCDSSVFLISHAHLADMLGTTRSTVTVAAGHLQQQGLIRYSRGKIHIVDRPGLELACCECYATLQSHLTAVAHPLPLPLPA